MNGYSAGNEGKDVEYKMPLVFAVSLGRTDGSMGFDKILLNGVISALLKWFIEVSSMVYQRKPMHLKYLY